MTYKLSFLSNKLPVVTYHMPFAKTISINLIVSVGSRYENSKEEGISHFLEHMAFKGTKTRSSKKIAEEFDAIGGQFNAYTSKEQTVYYAKVLVEHLEKAMDIISDIILESSYNEEEIAKECNVICQEISESQDSPDDLAYENLIKIAFANQPLGKPILGTESSISKFNTLSFNSYVAKHYKAQNMVLSAAGCIDHEQFVKIAQAKFHRIKQGELEIPSNSIYTIGESKINKDLEQSVIMLGFKSCSYKNIKEFYHVQILSLILGGGLSSRLFQNIRENLGLAYSVGSFNSAFQDNGLFSLYAGTSHDNVMKVALHMVDEIKKIRDLLDQEELERAKNQIKVSIMMAEEKTSFKSEEIGKNYSLFQKFISVEDVLKEISNTTTLDIIRIANKVFSSKPCISVVGAKTSLVNSTVIEQNLE